MGERLAVREDNVRDRVGRHVREPVLALEPELVVAQERVGLDERMAGRAGVEAKARQRQLLGHGAAARKLARLEHDHLVARLREVRSGDEAVVPAAGHDDVEHLAHADSSRCQASGTEVQQKRNRLTKWLLIAYAVRTCRVQVPRIRCQAP